MDKKEKNQIMMEVKSRLTGMVSTAMSIEELMKDVPDGVLKSRDGEEQYTFTLEGELNASVKQNGEVYQITVRRI